MCGIFGIINRLRDDKKMTDAFINNAFIKGVRRGPENSQYQKINSVTEFGFHRLAINGLNDEANQPFEIDNIVLICNGEIYNYKELYEMLETTYTDIKPNSTSDCEVIIHLYIKYGMVETLKMLNGEFAFALYDKTSGQLWIARDPYGVRALYTGFDVKTGLFIFGSELKMLHPFMELNSKLWINQFKPGSYQLLELDNNMWNINKKPCKYHSCPFNNSLRDFCFKGSYQYALKNINETLNNCVRRRVTTSDRPIACLLSGGLDSSLITALVCKYYDPSKLETFSIGMPGSEDSQYAEMVAKHLGTKHTTITLTEDDFFNAIPEVIQAIESYDTTSVRASVGNYLVAKYISNHSDAKVIFNGDGSDEVTGGYMYFHAAPNELEFDKECHRLIDDIYMFDVLRSDKSISSNGLEPRTPFLDKEFVDMYMTIPCAWRYHVGNKECEKHLLRSAFESENLLPDKVLWRTKEAFSDGVSSLKKSWFEIIEDKINEKKDDIFKNYVDKSYLINPPTTIEQKYYRGLFEHYYENMGYVLPYFWMPKFVNATDSSARTLTEYKNNVMKIKL